MSIDRSTSFLLLMICTLWFILWWYLRSEWFDQRGAWLRLARAQEVSVYFNFEDCTINFAVESLEQDTEISRMNPEERLWVYLALRIFNTALRLALISHQAL